MLGMWGAVPDSERCPSQKGGRNTNQTVIYNFFLLLRYRFQIFLAVNPRRFGISSPSPTGLVPFDSLNHRVTNYQSEPLTLENFLGSYCGSFWDCRCMHNESRSGGGLFVDSSGVSLISWKLRELIRVKGWIGVLSRCGGWVVTWKIVNEGFDGFGRSLMARKLCIQILLVIRTEMFLGCFNRESDHFTLKRIGFSLYMIPRNTPTEFLGVEPWRRSDITFCRDWTREAREQVSLYSTLV